MRKNIKHINIILVSLVILFMLVSCRQSNGDTAYTPLPNLSSDAHSETSVDVTESESASTIEPTAKTELDSPNADNKTESGDNILIAYFSRVGNTDFPADVDAITSASLNIRDGELKGNTELVASYIHQWVGGDMLLVKSTEKYSPDYNEVVDYVQQEHRQGVYPAVSSEVENMEAYEIVFLGFPNWDYDMPMAIYSFLEEYDFSGKVIAPFCTHEGSRFSGAVETLRGMFPDATILDGLAIPGSRAANAQADVENWLRENGFVE